MLINNNIVKIGSSIFNFRIENSCKDLRSLNRNLDKLYDALSEIEIQTHNIGELTFKIDLLLQTVKSLYKATSKLKSIIEIEKERQILKLNYSSLYEINEDLKNFNPSNPHFQELKQLLSQAGQALHAMKI